ncbi:MAG: hypothetical protein U1E77_20830 [Inhella sp.]
MFTQLPIALEQIRGWVPLGALNPAAHTFPTDHQYLYTTAFGGDSRELAIPVRAPAALRITLLYRMQYGNTGADYSLFFQPCADLFARFGHLVRLAPELLAAAGPIDQRCQTYEPTPGSPVTLCESRNLALDWPAGGLLGELGLGGSTVLDWWLQDRRIAALRFANPARFAGASAGNGFDLAHTVPASDYFVPALAASLQPRLGRFDGSLRRTALPLGGSIEVDVEGSARGYWFNPAQPYPSEAWHAALALDPIEPQRLQVFSLGLSQRGAGPYVASFEFRHEGTLNRAFEDIRADGRVYCAEPLQRADAVLLQQLDAQTLQIEVRPGAGPCPAEAARAFGPGAVRYVR